MQTSPSFSFLELLEDFLKEYGQVANKGVQAWEGNATSLLADLSLDPRIGGIASRYTPNQIASFLGQLKSRGYNLERVRNSHQRVWRIPFELKNEAGGE